MWLYNVAKFLLVLPVKMIYPTKVYGKKQLPNDRVIIAINHKSGLDSFFPALIFRRNITFLCKEELCGNFFTKWLFKNLGCVPIARKGSDFAAMKKIISTLEADRAVALYPEGTRNKIDPCKLLPFKSGVSMFALKTGADILPVVILNKPKAFRKNYILVGDFIHVEKPEGRVNAEMIEEFTREFQSKMDAQLEELQTRVANLKHGSVTK